MSDIVVYRVVKDMKNREAVDLMIGIITKLYAFSGQDESAEGILFKAQELIMDCKKRFRDFDMSEIATALENGIRGDYGKYYGINNVSFINWLKAYSESGDHYDYISRKNRNINQKQLVIKTDKTAGELIAETQKHCKTTFENFKKQGILFDYGSPCFNYLHFEHKSLVLSKKEIDDAFIEAKAEILKELSIRKASTKLVQRKGIENQINEVLANNDHDLIEIKAKFILLRNYFTKLIKENKQLFI